LNRVLFFSPKEKDRYQCKQHQNYRNKDPTVDTGLIIDFFSLGTFSIGGCRNNFQFHRITAYFPVFTQSRIKIRKTNRGDNKAPYLIGSKTENVFSFPF